MRTDEPASALPIESVLPELNARLTESDSVLLQAPPGAGKTTCVPLSLLRAPWLDGRRILMLEPRRLAARAAAARMAELLGEPVGRTVGYRVRLDSRVSAQTRIEVLTEGVLTRYLQTDPELAGTGLVIFDEFHERSLHADLALALCLDARRNLRPDLKLLVMSATLDIASLAALLDDAPIVTSQGRSFPVTVHHHVRDVQREVVAETVATVRKALAAEAGDLLVFLPGAGEIRRALAALREDPACAGMEVLPLYGELSREAQDHAIRPPTGDVRRIVLATPIAETSLTIPGVRIVVDSGLMRAPRMDARSGLTRLVTVRVSRASAEQRAGRAGRVQPGVCYRLWTETTHRGLPAHGTPEILQADLAPLALELALWGVRDAAELTWLDPPPAPALAQARELLTALGALDSAGVITPAGREMASLPVHPRLAHMLRQGRAAGMGALACDVAALLSERDPLAAQRAAYGCDLGSRVEALVRARSGAGQAGLAHIEKLSRHWRALLDVDAPAVAFDPYDIGLLLAMAYPDRVAAQRAPESERYLLSGGRGASLPQHDPLARYPWLAVAQLDAGRADGTIFLAAPVREADLRELFAAVLAVRTVTAWDARQEAVIAARETCLGALVLAREPLSEADPAALTDAMLEGVRQMGLQVLPWTPAARAFQARVLCMRAWFPEEPWPDLADARLLETLEEWLAPYLAGVTRREQLARVDLARALEDRLDWKSRQRLDEGAPTHITVPSGSRLALAYEPGAAPVLAVKLQEMFGLADTPRIAWGRVPVMLHLLSPARRPVQVTQDLRGFWDRTYAEVKKELKGRYPKHPWPDDPWNAPPTARAKPRPG